MPSEPEVDPPVPTADLPPTRPETIPTPTGPSDVGDARVRTPCVRAESDEGVDRVLEKLDEFLAEIERTMAALVDEVAPAA